ncbi:MAG: D-alanyl-D-alanine carboxypeptidase/D-alanyl-D-alanine-endopeptidase [Ignavibacteria bacterium RBG_16_34_14]|nr:MAG: D-alanyl-D-alanine carboxypeptidase/D-alanyl-D-alanine-endopeptidase [Ignavibacteria bacterium RBG_16_34_14]
MLNKFYFLFIVIIFFTSGFSQEKKNLIVSSDTLPNYSYSTIPEFWTQMDDIFNDPNFSNANWGVLIQSLETGEYFYRRNEDKLFHPASNMKLFTTAAGLILLGSEYKFSTSVFMNGTMDGSILKGNLIIQGGGDPTISGRFYNGDVYKVFNNWADSLLAFGIDEIEGNIIGDDNLFDDVGLGSGWSWDYETYWFSAPSGAISFNDNCVDLVVSVDTVTNQAKIKISPDTKYVTLVNDLSVVSKDTTALIDVYRERGTNIINIFGTVRAGRDSIKTYATVNNPTQYAMVVLKEVLERKGIKVKGYAVDIDDVEGSIDFSKMEQLFVNYSLPLKDIIKVINKSSQNFFAEQLLKIIGLEEEGYGTVENGVKAVSGVLNEMGINPESLVMVDGSGLSRLDLVSPRHVVNILNFMYKSNYYIPFFNSLPIAGIDGSLGTRMKGTRAENQVRAKTGYLAYVRSLSGYAYTGDNEPIAFSIIANNFTVPVKLAENIQDLVCLRLVNFRRK